MTFHEKSMVYTLEKIYQRATTNEKKIAVLKMEKEIFKTYAHVYHNDSKGAGLSLQSTLEIIDDRIKALETIGG